MRLHSMNDVPVPLDTLDRLTGITTRRSIRQHEMEATIEAQLAVDQPHLTAEQRRVVARTMTEFRMRTGLS